MMSELPKALRLRASGPKVEAKGRGGVGPRSSWGRGG